MTGSIIFSMVKTRPDIAYVTSLVSRFIKNPSYQFTKIIKTILKYLKESKNREIIYSKEEKLKIDGYSDSDWTGDKESQRFISKFIFILNGRLIS